MQARGLRHQGRVGGREGREGSFSSFFFYYFFVVGTAGGAGAWRREYERSRSAGPFSSFAFVVLILVLVLVLVLVLIIPNVPDSTGHIAFEPVTRRRRPRRATRLYLRLRL